ncbi:MAG: hypothetical protein IPI43_13185 [Sandaracinaceae bacterium]|nr:hypothetical protein [Sandaracinaceae bacterium]
MPGRRSPTNRGAPIVRLRYLDDGACSQLEQQERRASPSPFWIDTYDGPVSTVAHGHAVLGLTDPVHAAALGWRASARAQAACSAVPAALVLDDARPGERTFVEVDALRRCAPMRVGPEASGWA